MAQDRYGGPEVLELTDLARPVVGKDEALLRVRAVRNAGAIREVSGCISLR
jgi:hypothetical protein